jgi:hypothetical protein
MNLVDWLAIAAAFLVTAWFVKTVLDKNRDAERFEEDDARDFFDEHGHWPDETPAQAEARARRAADSERRARAEERDF